MALRSSRSRRWDLSLVSVVFGRAGSVALGQSRTTPSKEDRFTLLGIYANLQKIVDISWEAEAAPIGLALWALLMVICGCRPWWNTCHSLKGEMDSSRVVVYMGHFDHAGHNHLPKRTFDRQDTSFGHRSNKSTARPN